MIEFQNISKVYNNDARALEDVNLKIEDGEFVFIIGESGAGKSTLIKLLSCEERPTSGRVVIEDYEIGRLRRRLIPLIRRKIGMVFQDFRLISTKTVYENIAFAMEIVGARKKHIKQRVMMVLSVVGLRHKADCYPDELSGGEAQRVGLARAMVNNPRLILADEPTGNLDPANSEAVMALLEEINRAGTTVIVCTHDMVLVEQMGKRVIELSQGKIISDKEAIISEDPALCYVRPEEEIEEISEFFTKINIEHLKHKQIDSEEYAEKRRRRNVGSLAERIAKLQWRGGQASVQSAEEQADPKDAEDLVEGLGDDTAPEYTVAEFLSEEKVDAKEPFAPIFSVDEEDDFLLGEERSDRKSQDSGEEE